jgi:hypothetical protein
VVAVLGDRRQAPAPRGRDREGLGRVGVQHPVAPLELGSVDGEVGLVDQLVRVRPVPRERRDADRDRRADRLARRLDVERALRDGAPDALGDLEGLLRARLGQQDAELLAAESGRDVVVAQEGAEDLRDPLQHRVAGEMPVRVVDLPEEIEVGHDQRQRPVETGRARQLLVQRLPEVTCVEEAGLRVDAGLGLELRDRERPVDQDERRDRERHEPRVRVPERGDPDAERRQHEVGRQALEAEEPRIAGRDPPCEREHRREQRVVDPDEQETGGQAAERELEVVVPGEDRQLADEVRPAARREDREREVGDVEDLDVPDRPVLQPVRHVLHRRDEHDELGRQQERRRDQEDDRGLVRLVLPRPDEEELGDGGRCGQDQERDPVVPALVEAGQERRRDCRSRADDEHQVDERCDRQALPADRLTPRRLAPEADVARDGAHVLAVPGSCRTSLLTFTQEG